MFGVNASLLRFWEKEFKQIQPRTNARGKRSYRAKDIEVIRSIYVLVKEQGFTLEGAKKALTSYCGNFPYYKIEHRYLMSLVPFRGKRNESSYVLHVARIPFDVSPFICKNQVSN